MKNLKKRWTVQKLFHSWRVCVFCQIVIAVSAVIKIAVSIGVIQNLVLFHSETAENENVLEYSSMWLYQWRNVLIFHERWWKFGHWHLKYFFGGAGEFEKRWVLNVSIRFRVAQYLDHWSFHYCVNISNKFMRKCAKYAPLIDDIALSGLTFKETHFQARQMFCWSHRTLKRVSL